MLILAIDPATVTGCAEGEPGKTPLLTSHRFRNARADEPVEIAYQRATFWLANRLKDPPLPDEIVIEQPFATVNTTFDTALIALGLYGIFCGIALCKNISVRPVKVQTWRKAILSAGNLKGKIAKEEAEVLCKRLEWMAPDHNAAEAGCIWLWGCGMLSPKTTQRHEPLFLSAK
jgi:hypothetical protein